MKRTAMYWEREGSAIKCLLCPHHCSIPLGGTGRCLARKNEAGNLIAESWGLVTALHLDPIEKKPLHCFYPGSAILSVGSYGCNLRCPFCQNHTISMERAESRKILPEELASLALQWKDRSNIGVAYTYNEPLIGYEYVLDCAKLTHAQGLKNVLVTNGTVALEPLLELLPWIDAMNIDLKCFSDATYRRLGGMLETVKHTIREANTQCHVEVTTLVVPGISDREEQIEELTKWLASLNKEIPYHISQYVPRYRYGEPPVDKKRIYALRDIAKRHLRTVFTGNCW